MKETIIFSNRLNQTEFLRSLAKLNKPTFNTRIFNSFSLASEGLERSNYVINKSLIQKEDEVFKYIKIINDLNDKHFKSYQDIYHLATTIRNLRLLITDENEIDILKEKLHSYVNEENIDLIIKLLDIYLKDDSFLDYVSYLRLAIKHAKKSFDEIIIFKEEHISSLEKLLIKELSNNVKEISVLDYLEIKQKEIDYKDINPYYGVDNEVEEVISRIYENKFNLDDTNIVLVTTKDYINSLFRVMKDKNIPMTFNKGLPITLFNSYKLYELLLSLERNDKFDLNGYRKLFKSECFDKSNFKYLDILIDVLGRMKISFSKEDNLLKFNAFNESKNRDVILNELYRLYEDKDVIEFISELQTFIFDMSNGISCILNKYLKKENELDDIALEHINDVVIQSNSIEDVNVKNTYLDSVSGLYICMSGSKEGAINVTLLNNATSTIRKHNFVLGLNANNFPGKRVENYLINDEELLAVNDEAITSEKQILLKNKEFDNYVLLNSSLGNDIYLSYSFFDLIESNEINPSSKIFEIVSNTKEENYLNNLKAKTNYFSSKINSLTKIGKAYLNNNLLNLDESMTEFKKSNSDLLNRIYYPSDIDVFFDCQVKFYVTRILKIKDENEYDRYKIIDENHFGTLLHYLMKKYHGLNEEEFVTEANQLFIDYLKLNYPLGKYDADLKEFNKCALNGYKYLKQFADLKFETKVIGNYSKLSIGGRYDCLAKKDNEYVLIDFKADRSIKRNKEDPTTIRQLLIYLKLLNDKNIKVTKGEYFYFRYNNTINIIFSNDYLMALESDLNEFIMCLENKSFKIEDNDKKCRFCPINGFCKGKGGSL